MTKDNIDVIRDQFTRQAGTFSQSPPMQDEEAIRLLIKASGVKPDARMLDVACGPGMVACGFAASGVHAVGIDVTPAMIERAKQLAKKKGLQNVEWHVGAVTSLPFEDNSFDVVTCRFAFHHFPIPADAFAEMKRVCRPGGRIVVCDGYASDDPAKAAAFNAMERLRDPSTIRFLTLGELESFFQRENLQPAQHFYRVTYDVNTLMQGSFPDPGDEILVRDMIVRSVDGDALGLNARRDGGQVWFDYSAVILAAQKLAGGQVIPG
ncbi:MAG: methyltransferase domain-containing protein [Alphaproteobacteria bacterium]